MKNWKVELTAEEKIFVGVKILGGIFQWDAFSLLLFAIMSRNYILKKCTGRYKFTDSQEKIYHFMYMQDIKLFQKRKKELGTLIQTIRIYSQHIRMWFGLGKCAMHITKNWKRLTTKGIELQIEERIKAYGEKENHKNLGILKADTIKQAEMKENIKKSNSDERKKCLKPSSTAEISSKR